MSDGILNEVLAIAGDVSEQLKFLREIGLEDFGDSACGVESAPGANLALSSGVGIELPAPESAPASNEVSAPQQTPEAIQAGLFGETETVPRGAAAKGPRLPVIESRDLSLEAIRDELGDCRRCKLHEHRTNIVYGEGTQAAKLVFVGEGPGAEEDASGRPFVGRAGQLLDKIIAAIGLAREDVYIANIVKCRPPGNRTPERDEVETCEPFLFRQLAFIRPRVIVALGSPAFQCLLRTREPITRARGQWREWNGIKVMPTFHPAFLLRSPDKKREVWEDMKKVRDYLNLG